MELLTLIRSLRDSGAYLTANAGSLMVNVPVGACDSLLAPLREHKVVLIRLLRAAEGRCLRKLAQNWEANIHGKWRKIGDEVMLEWRLSRLDAGIVALHEVLRHVAAAQGVRYVLGSVSAMQLLGEATMWDIILEMAGRIELTKESDRAPVIRARPTAA